MNYYLVPGEIAESLDLTAIRKKTPGGMFLLSESDLLPYGIDRALNEGAVILSDNKPKEQPVENEPQENDTAEDTQETETPAEEETETEASENETGNTEEDKP